MVLVIDIFGMLVSGLFCALVVKFLGGDMKMGFIAGFVFEVIYIFPLIYMIYIFPFASFIIPIAILTVLIYFIVKFDITRALGSAALTYILIYVLDLVLAYLPIRIPPIII